MRAISALLALVLLSALAVPLASSQVGVTGGVGNVAPVITSVSVTGSSFDPTASTTTGVPITAVVTDSNGCTDVTDGTSTVTASLLRSDNSVLVAATAMTFQSCSLGVAATFTKTLNLQYHDPAGTYKVLVAATDLIGATIDSAVAPGYVSITYTSLVALGTGMASSFSFGASVSPGSFTPTNQGIAVLNGGNTQIDATVLGSALTLASPAATIPVGSVKYSLNSDMSSSAALTTSAVTLGSFNLAPAAGASRTLYLQLVVPAAGVSQYSPAGSYTGTLTVGAVSG